MAILGDVGKAQVDAGLQDALKARGVTEGSATELSRTDNFGGQNIGLWLKGLEHAAARMNGPITAIDWGTLPEPWPYIGPALQSADDKTLDKTLSGLIATYPLDVGTALLEAIAAVASEQVSAATAPKPAQQAGPLTQSQATQASAAVKYLAPVDPDLAKKVLAILKTHQKGVDPDYKRKAAGEVMLDWMIEHGRFVRTWYDDVGRYLYRDGHQLLPIDTAIFRGWLYRLTGVSLASTDFNFLRTDCETVGRLEADPVEVVRVAHWDAKAKVLRVSDFGGQVYVLNGTTIELEANGDGPVVFEEGAGYTPVEPDFTGDGSMLDWWTGLLNTDDLMSVAGRQYALRVWLLATFFYELCPTQPILVLQGEAGSGKSMLLRVLLKLLFGPAAQVGGVPDKPDGFTAAAAASHVLTIDNLDKLEPWLQDKLARVSTGAIDNYRILYSNNQLGKVVYRTWLAITSRTPDTLRRDDLADRVLVLPVDRIDDNARQKEGNFLVKTLALRSLFWGDLLTTLNRVVAELREHGTPDYSPMRMADFETLGRTIAKVEDREDLWKEVVKEWGSQAASLLLADSELADALEGWLKTPVNRQRRVDTRTLYQELTLCLFGTERPSATWPKSPKAFGRMLAGLRRALIADFDVRWQETGRRTYYEFDLKS